ncbi:MAG: MarC family protein [Alphaproteobacteria bacterium]|nr:MarC family protein [Alphaproteobacteria bacterium]
MIHEAFYISFATFFATISPLNVSMIFASLTADVQPQERIRTAVKGTLIALIILLTFSVFGDALLGILGITLPAMRIGGGVLLLLIAIKLVFAQPSGASSATKAEQQETVERADLSIFPIATPMIAGPGTMGAIILLMADSGDDLRISLWTVAGMVSVLCLTLLAMLMATQVQRLLGKIGVHVIARVFGVLLAALSMQFILDGLENSVVFKRLIA